MKIEKLNENKIKITFNRDYLENNDISIHSFMSNSIESQALFSALLDAAEKEVGFSTENYKISVEALTQNKDIFTLIVSRFSEKQIVYKPRLHVSRKLSSFENKISLYKFEDIETLFAFSKYISSVLPESIDFLDEKSSLYFYNNCYFLAINRVFLDKKTLFKITSFFAEFSEFIHISKITFQKLKEVGNMLIEKNAISKCI